MTKEIPFQEIIYPRAVRFFSVSAQIIAVAALLILYTTLAYFHYQRTGTMWGYPLRISILFAPLYEELIFRGVIFAGLMRFYLPRTSVVISSLLFGLWHLKNIFFISPHALIAQMLYTAFLFGPVAALLTMKTKNVWCAVILHYLNRAYFLDHYRLAAIKTFYRSNATTI